MSEPDFTDAERAAIARALRRLAGYDHDETVMEIAARAALRVLVAALITQPDADDPPLFAALAMPAWDAPSGVYLTVATTPLLDLLEVP